MAKTAKDQIAALEARITALESELHRAKAPPAPATPAKPPSWAQQSTNVGMAYCGEPSVPQHGASGTVGITRVAEDRYRYPDGIIRDGSGRIAPINPAAEARPAGPNRSAAHEMAVEILERDLGRR
jgi:hypothetical protein